MSYNAVCNLVSDAIVELTTADAQFFALHDPNDANGQFNGMPTEEGELRAERLSDGKPRHGDWGGSTHVDGYCDERYLGSRRLDLACTKRVSLSSVNYTFLNVFPNDNCAGRPGHIETWASDNGIDAV